MQNLILKDILEMLDINTDDNCYDKKILSFINKAVSVLDQMGVPQGNTIVDENTVWADYIPESNKSNIVKNYVMDYIYSYTKLNFDPPSSTYLCDNLKESLKEDAWRLLAVIEENGAVL